LSDLPYIQEAQEVKITGQDSTGNTVNYVGADSNGNLQVVNASEGPVTPGTVATKSILTGAQYNSTSPTLTTGQQSALQLNSAGSLNVNITSGVGSITATVGTADKTTFTYGTTSELPIGGVYQDTSPTLATGTSGAIRSTQNRGLHVNLRDSSGNEKLGSSLSAASIPVVIASDQGSIPVTMTTGHVNSYVFDGAGNAIGSAGGALNSAITTISGNSIGSTGGALNAYIIGGTITSITNSIKSTLFDGSGNSLSSTSGALNVNITSGSVTVTGSSSVKVFDGAGNAIGSTGGALNTAITTISGSSIGSTGGALNAYITGGTVTSITNSVKVNLYDSSGTSLSSTAGALNSYITGGNLTSITNSVKVNLYDSSGTSLSSTAGALNSYITGGNLTSITNSVKVNLYDGGGNSLSSTSGALNVALSGSSTVTANQGTAAITANAWPYKITDGTNTAAVKAASTAAIATDPALVVAISPNNSLSVLQATASNLNAQVVGNVASGSADSGNGIKISGVYNTIVPSLSTGNRGDIQLDSRGALQVTLLDGSRQSYSTSVTTSLPISATDVITIGGSASKTVRITLVKITGISTTAITTPVLLIKRSSTNTGGGISAPSIVPHDSNNSNSGVTVLYYSANATGLGTAVGTMRQDRLTFQTIASTGEGAITWDFGTRPTQAVVLRGTSQLLCVNLNGVTVTGGSISCDIEWSEE
jgi:hypothetical protein